MAAVRAAAGTFVASTVSPLLAGAITATSAAVFGAMSIFQAKRKRDVRIASGEGDVVVIDPINLPDIPDPVTPTDPINQPDPPAPVVPDDKPPVPPANPGDPSTAELRGTPTPCALYQIKKGDTLFGLIKQAYGFTDKANVLAIAKQVNNHPYNVARFHVTAPAGELALWPTRISFNPRFGLVAAQRLGPSKGHSFAAFYFPCLPSPAAEDPVNQGGILPYCPQWSVSMPARQSITARIFPEIDSLRGDPDFDNYRRQINLPTAEEMAFAGPYYLDLALWLAANTSDFGGIGEQKPPRPLALPCSVIGPDQLALQKLVRDYYVNVTGLWL